MENSHIAISVLIGCCIFYPVTKAQITGEVQHSLSLADAARQNLEHKRDLVRRSKVITDDDLKVQFVPAAEGGASLLGVANAGGTPPSVDELPIALVSEGQAAPGNENAVAVAGGIYMGSPATSQTTTPNPGAVAAVVAADWAAIAAAEPPKRKPNESELEFEIATVKAQIAAAELQLNLRRRELALDEDMIYSNPNYLAWHTGKAELEAEQQRIDESQREIDGLKTRLAFLEELQRQESQR